jgi:hypothetical protein
VSFASLTFGVINDATFYDEHNGYISGVERDDSILLNTQEGHFYAIGNIVLNSD